MTDTTTGNATWETDEMGRHIANVYDAYLEARGLASDAIDDLGVALNVAFEGLVEGLDEGEVDWESVARDVMADWLEGQG